MERRRPGQRPWAGAELLGALRTPGVDQTRTATPLAGGEVAGALALAHGADSDGGDPRELGAMIRLAGEALARARSAEDERRLASIVDGSAAAMFAIDPDGTITSWNLAAERMTGWTAAEAIGQSAVVRATHHVVAPSRGRGALDLRGSGSASG